MKEKYIYAYDPTIKKRVIHVVKNGWAISLITEHRFKYSPKKERSRKKKIRKRKSFWEKFWGV